ncbi:MAG: TM1812 family CRISPR-associated protein [Polyangiales bacterium]
MIHWFFTVGTNPSDAAYVRTGTHTQVVVQKYVTPALLKMGWPVAPSEFAAVVPHVLTTVEVLEKHAALRDCIAAVAPELAARLDFAAERALVRRDQDAIWNVVRAVLSSVRDGDEVVLEITNGIRSITTGFLLASGLLIAARPGVTVRAVTYAELNAAELPEGFEAPPGITRASPVYDLLPFLKLFSWSQAVHAMSHYLDPAPTLALLRKEKPSSTSIELAEASLTQLATALALNLPVEVEQALDEWRNLRGTVPDFSPAASLTLDHVDATLDALHVPAGGRGRLEIAHLRFDLDLIDRLVAAQRLADAARALREWFVNAVIVAWNEGANWLDHERVRAPAEAALHGLSPRASAEHRELRERWDQSARYRNAVSHLGYNQKHEVEEEALERFLQTTPNELRALLDRAGLAVFELPRRQKKGYLANAFSLNMLADLDCNVRIAKISQKKLSAAVAGLPSIVGHADTAALFTRILGRDVEAARDSVQLERGDYVIVGQYSGPRLEEGATTLPMGASVKWVRVDIV